MKSCMLSYLNANKLYYCFDSPFVILRSTHAELENGFGGFTCFIPSTKAL